MTRAAATTRPAAARDIAAIAAIYNQGIAERVATFETESRRPQELAAWIDPMPTHPLLVAEDGGRVIGWARVSAYDDRAAYVGVGEYAVYVDRDARGAGVGRKLLEALVDEAQRLGFWKLVGLLFTDNEPSRALARACGFRDVGVHRRHGRLDGEWRDVVVVERLLGEAAGD